MTGTVAERDGDPAVPPATETDGGVAPEAATAPPQAGKSLTIGAVCKALSQEFPDISISKIRYLEDQKLLAPRRTPGGYRLYSTNDVARLRTILRLQRDEFLPLRVIRQELAAGRSEPEIAQATASDGAAAAPDARPGAALRRLTFSIAQRGAMYSLEDVVEDTGAEPRLVAELEDFGIIKGDPRAGTKYYDETEREIVRAVTELSRYGVAGRNLRVFKTSAERESALLQQILAPAPALAQSRAAQGGGRGAGEPRRGRVAPQAPAARPRPPTDRAVSRPADLRALIRDIPDFPKPGIVFKDITPLLLDPHAIDTAVEGIAEWAGPRGVDFVVAAEARGFILGAAIARELGAGFVPARKPGKLPAEVVTAEYILEYGIDALEMHADALAHGARVLIHDDLLATGGTARALAELVGAAGRDRGRLRVPRRARVPRRPPPARGVRRARAGHLRRRVDAGRALPHAAPRPPATSGAVLEDPYALPRWWPLARRVEGVGPARLDDGARPRGRARRARRPAARGVRAARAAALGARRAGLAVRARPARVGDRGAAGAGGGGQRS